VNRVRCRIALYEGGWRAVPSKQAVKATLEHTCPARNGSCLAAVEFAEPSADVAVEAEVSVLTRWCHAEIVRDAIIEALLRRLTPEYESMIEVEVCE